MIEAIVPAFNESATIEHVVRTLLAANSAVARVLVVDDGSKDDTAEKAALCGADVLRMRKNAGKGAAMLCGLHATTHKRVGFFDADLLGLRVDHITELVRIAEGGKFDMLCGLRDYGSVGNIVQLAFPTITGERVCTRDFLLRVPSDCWSGYAIETAMNDTARRLKLRVGLLYLKGLTIRNKVHKSGGALRGVSGHAKMAAQILRVREALRQTRGRSCMCDARLTPWLPPKR